VREAGGKMNTHIAKIREICAFLRQVVPICYLQALQHKLDEIVAEVDAMEKELKPATLGDLTPEQQKEAEFKLRPQLR
jgi:hypothetical protein